MTTELLRPGYSNISCTNDQCVFTGALMPTELEVSTEKKDKLFLKRLKFFFNLFVRDKLKEITSQYKGSIPYILSSY